MAWPFSLQSKILREFSGLEQGTSSTGAMVAVDVFCGWGNEILSTWSIVCPAMKHSWLLSLRELLKLQKTLSLSPLSGVGGEGKEGARRVMFLVHEPDVLFRYHCSEKLKGEKQKLSWAVLKKRLLVWVRFGFEAQLCHLQTMGERLYNSTKPQYTPL